MADSTNNPTNTPNTPEPAPQKNTTMLYVTLIIVLLVALGAGYFLISNGTPANETQQDENGNATGPVAVVNGEEIARDTYTQAYTQYEAVFAQQNSNVTEAQLQQQVMTDLVNSVLLKQAAMEAGYVATDAEIDAEINAIVEGAGGADAFATQIEQAGLSQEEVRQQVAEQLAMNAYVQAQADVENITVSEEEITSFYEEISAQNETLPALEEVRGQIEQQIRSQKQQERVSGLISELRADAEIEILI